ncbi:MAG: hypothetical protein FJX57_14230 [Alphaproteobacteria bacterium]|nr:hypothetical protein [Alphaproteobacteria bacterium]
MTLGGLCDLERAATLTFPCIAKPTTKHPEWGRHFKKAYRLASFDELASIYREVAPVVPDVIVQEWIVGGDSDVYFCLQYRDASGRPVASFTGRKIRQWPPGVGGTASCMPADEAAAELDDLTTRFFDAVGFVGIGSMEFKRDRRSGRYAMIEPTVGRTDYQEEVAALNGVNLPFAAYASLCGIPIPPAARPSRRRLWRDGVNDRRSLSDQPDAVDPPEARELQAVDTLWRLEDPGPWIAGWRRRLGGRLARVLGGGRAAPKASA